MKKLILVFSLILATFGSSWAQEIGVRFGNISSGNVAIDGVFSTSKFSRIHMDVSFGDGVGIDLLFDFLNKPLGINGLETLNWYAGVGPYVDIDDPFWFGAVGELGLEYRFAEVPIALGFDWRPTVSFIEKTDFYADVFGLNIRYVFGQ